MAPLATLARDPEMMVKSDLLGSIDVDPEDVIDFKRPLFGFPDCLSFVLIAAKRKGFYWLQSAEHSALVFVLIDPFLYFDEYVVDIPPAALADIGVKESSDAAVFAIVTLPDSRGGKPTANLQGPVAINLTSGQAMQLALADSEFGVRQPFDANRYPI